MEEIPIVRVRVCVCVCVRGRGRGRPRKNIVQSIKRDLVLNTLFLDMVHDKTSMNMSKRRP